MLEASLLKEGGKNGSLCHRGPVRNARPRWDDLLMTFFTKINRGIINALKRCLCINDKHILDKQVLHLDVRCTKPTQAHTEHCTFAVKTKNVKKRLQLRSCTKKRSQFAFPMSLSRISVSFQSKGSTLFPPNQWNLRLLPFTRTFGTLALIPLHIQKCAFCWLNIADADYTTMGGWRMA